MLGSNLRGHARYVRRLRGGCSSYGNKTSYNRWLPAAQTIHVNHPIAKISVAGGFLALVLAEAPRANAQDRPAVITARKARDQADIGSLRRVIDAARTEAQQHETAEACERLAQFELWLCEAAHQHNEDKLIKQAAQDGVAAAEKAIALNPNSSEAHRLLEDALGALIPQVFGGGVRYGRRSSEALDKAVDLDPKKR